MNLALVTSPLLFIGPSLRNVNFKDSSQKIFTNNRFDSNLGSVVIAPAYNASTQLLHQETIAKLNKEGETDDSLVTYTGAGLALSDSLKIPSREDLVSSLYGSKPLINTLAKVFKNHRLTALNEYQKPLFDELSLGRDVILHSYTSSGKTFAVILYMVLRYYYQIPSEWLTSKAFSDLLVYTKSAEPTDGPAFIRKQSPMESRVLVLCPTKELAVQCAKQIETFTDGNKDVIHLLIDEHDLCPEVTNDAIFIVGSSNQVESYLLNKDERHTRSILQTIDYVFLDEMDRLIRVPNQYAPLRKKRLLNEKPGSSHNICQTLLAISPNKLRLVSASASVSRQHIRRINSLIRLYRRNADNVTAVIRKKTSATDTGRYVSIPQTVKHYYSVSRKDTLESKVKNLASLLNSDGGRSIVFLGSGSLFALKNELKKYNIECKILHHEFGIKDNIKAEDSDWKNGPKDGSDSTLEMIGNLQSSIQDGGDNFVIAASTDSARGIHLPTLDSVYILGKPRNVNEYIHIAGRVGRCSRTGRCVTIDSKDRIRILLSWQKQTNTNILNISHENSTKEPEGAILSGDGSS